jgi:mono/diheme cytochrome c family protein
MLCQAASGADTSWAELQRGKYLVAAGDCAACHTQDGGQPFAGGRAIPTPFGTIYSTNLTPDRQTGIGNWTNDEFYRAMHSGIGPGGEHFYPAFPYPWFTKLSRADVRAIRAYLSTLDPISQRNRGTDLMWPFSWRWLMTVWNWLFFDEGTFQPNPTKSTEWNRGAYLVEGAAHCGACHSPKNLAGAVEHDKRFHGGLGENWFATDLTGDPRMGLGDWSKDEIVEYLKTGSNDKAGAAGPMAEVVSNSTRLLSNSDLTAIAIYFKGLARSGSGDQTGGDRPDADLMSRGGAIYVDQCIGCHRTNGSGIAGVFPPLKGSQIVQAKDPTTVINLVLAGAQEPSTAEKPAAFAMPAFGWKLSDDDIAALVSYLRNTWGNRGSSVSADAVADARHTLSESPD